MPTPIESNSDTGQGDGRLTQPVRLLKGWASQQLAAVKGRAIKAGDHVAYAGAEYEVARVEQFPHGPMIGIYDEPPGKHVDYLNPGSVTLLPNAPCAATEGRTK